jgi:pyruvate/2-oxoglutarate/acetoin dehydrogenase E1 component
MLEFRTAIRDGIAEEMERDERVIHFGEDIAAPEGVFKVTAGLHERFGDRRIFDTPISELALAGAAFGSAVVGMRPIIEIMFGDFMALPMDSLINQSAKYWYLSNEQASVPLVVRTAVGAGGRFGAVHSQNPGTWMHGVPGLKVVAPSTPSDAKALMKAAIRDENPVVFLEHKRLYSVRSAEVDETPQRLGTARVVRPGTDVTVATAMRGVADALAAAETLAAEGLSVEVVDLRSLRPLDVPSVVASVARTHRLLAVEEGPRTGGWAAGLVGAVAAEALDELDDVWVLSTPELPVPFSPTLEDAFLPGADAIAAAVRSRLGVTAR